MIRFLKPPAPPALLVGALLLLSAAVRAASPDTSSALFKDPVVATGTGFEIKRSQVNDAFIEFNAKVVAKGQSIPEDKRAMVRSNLLQELVINQILLQKATADDKSKGGKLVDDYLAKMHTNSSSADAFDQRIKATGLTLAQLRQRMLEDWLCNDIRTRDITNGIVIKDADVKTFYQEHPDDFKLTERVRVQHILVLTMDPITQNPFPPEVKLEKLKLAKAVKARADKGEDFAALVKKYSDDPGTRDNGGEYTLSKSTRLAPEFIAAAFSMKLNQISDLVETQFGFYLIKLLEKLPPSTVEFAKAEPDIRGFLTKQAAEKALPAYLDKLKATAGVKILDPAGSDPVAPDRLPSHP
jgi:parvulin-like peptidyl-prolyl isomerase